MVALLAAVTFLPLIGLAALAIKLVDHGPVFYAQERRGLGGQRIRVWKLRTMCRDSERRLEEALAADPELRKEWEQHCKLARDPRIIPVLGGIFRRFSIDELPQFVNVLAGQMSIVGPRERPTRRDPKV